MLKEILYTAELSNSLKLSQHGDWFHNEKRFENAKLARLFHKSIQWNEEEKQYFVVIGQQRARFTVEDTAYFISAIEEKEQSWELTLADDSKELLDPKTLSMNQDGQFYCILKSGHRARFMRNTHQFIIQSAVDEKTVLIAGNKVSLIGT